MSEQEAVPAGVDTSTPSAARAYDYALGGKDNFQVDREAAARAAEALPDFREQAQANRAFLRRAVRFMARQGIRQFLDLGSGLPTVGNTHEIAREITPDAQVVYIDNDPVVLVHGRALLATDDNTAVVAVEASPAGRERRPPSRSGLANRPPTYAETVRVRGPARRT